MASHTQTTIVISTPSITLISPRPAIVDTQDKADRNTAKQGKFSHLHEVNDDDLKDLVRFGVCGVVVFLLGVFIWVGAYLVGLGDGN